LRCLGNAGIQSSPLPSKVESRDVVFPSSPGSTAGPYSGPLGPYGGPLGPYSAPLGPYSGSLGPYSAPLGPYSGSLGYLTSSCLG